MLHSTLDRFQIQYFKRVVVEKESLIFLVTQVDALFLHVIS